MLMKPKKDAALTIILSKRGKREDIKKPETNEAGEEVSYDKEMYKAHAEDVLKAMEAKDAEMLAMALKSFVAMCMDSEAEKPSEY